MDEKVEKLFGIKLFSWENWDDIDVGLLQFYNVHFNDAFESMQNFNGCTVVRDLDGKLSGYDENGNVLFELFAIEITEFFEQVKKNFLEVKVFLNEE